MNIIEKIAASKVSHTSDDINHDHRSYMNNDYHRYNLNVLPETLLLTELFIERFAYITNPLGNRHTNSPALIIGEDNYIKNEYFGSLNVKALLYSNGTVFMFWNEMYVDIDLFIKKDYLKIENRIPTPDMLIEYKITSRYNFDDISEYHFIDRNLR